MSTKFWLNDFTQLINVNNFSLNGVTDDDKIIKILNIISFFVIISGLILTFKTKKKKFFIYSFLILCIITVIYLIKFPDNFTPILKKIPNKSNFSQLDPINTDLTNSYDSGVFLTKDVINNPSSLNNAIYINQALNFNKGDIIAFTANGVTTETNIISNIQYTTDTQTPVLVLLNPIKNNYSKYTTKILKVSDSTPNIIVPPDANNSIERANNTYGPSDPYSLSLENYPKFTDNIDRKDYNLELSTYGGLEPGQPPVYQYQGPPYGDLKCRTSNINNPMGTINVTEYDAPPTMYGTCNIADPGPDGKNMDNFMTTNQEATVSQRVDDLLFHKGNAQAQFSPMPVDTLPDNQEAFAHFCYRSQTNLVNPKYASIFVNDPEKYKLVAKLARATGTENGGGGGY